MTLTARRLRDVLNYNPASGLFTWKVATSNCVRVGQVAGSDNGQGYLKIMIDGRKYRSHRLAWLYVHGVWPTHLIDHIDGDKSNNRIDNLREATNAENMRNSGAYATNTSGYKGVVWHKRKKRWQAKIVVHGRTIHIGYYDRPEAAYAAYCEASNRLYGQFARAA